MLFRLHHWARQFGVCDKSSLLIVKRENLLIGTHVPKLLIFLSKWRCSISVCVISIFSLSFSLIFLSFFSEQQIARVCLDAVSVAQRSVPTNLREFP